MLYNFTQSKYAVVSQVYKIPDGITHENLVEKIMNDEFKDRIWVSTSFIFISPMFMMSDGIIDINESVAWQEITSLTQITDKNFVIEILMYEINQLKISLMSPAVIHQQPLIINNQYINLPDLPVPSRHLSKIYLK